MHLHPVRLLLALSCGGLLSLASTAQAIAPTDAVHIGIEPQRVMTYHAAAQAKFRNSTRWQAWIQGEGQGWRGVFDEQTGAVHRMVGTGIDLGPTRNAAEVEQGVMAFVERQAHLLGVEGVPVALKSANYDARYDTWYVDVDVLKGGMPIYRGGLTFRIKHGNLILVGADSYRDVELLGGLEIDADAAVDASIALGPAPDSPHTLESVAPRALPWVGEDGEVTLRATWMVTTRTADPPGWWVSFIDGQTGKLLNVHNQVRFATIEGEHHIRTITGGFTVSPMPKIEVSNGGSTEFADQYGEFGLTGNLVSTLDGEYVSVRNEDGREGELEFTGDGLWTDNDATQAEIDSYVFLEQAWSWCQDVAPEVPQCTYDLRSNVNLNANCNAYWDGDVNFYTSGGGCNNTGEIADVNYHEWGHGFHYYSLLSGSFDGSLSEGAGDSVSVLMTDDPYIGPTFFTNGAAIREVATDKVYPDDYVNNNDYVHSNGLIFGGAIWDLKDLLVDDLGAEAGRLQASRIFAGTLKGGPTIESSYWEALVADDDDGNLGNGTPHLCAIADAFARHGLGDGTDAIASVYLDHEQPGWVPADVAIAIDAQIVSVAPECVTANADSAVIHYRIDGGDWETAPLSLVGEDATAELPAQPMGTFIEYWMSVENTDGPDAVGPTGGEITPYTVFVGDVLEVYCDDFESDDGGYTHALISGEDVEGADDWQWGAPLGEGADETTDVGADPREAFSGSYVWGNDLGEDNFNGQYQNEKNNRLTSVEVQLSHYADVFLSYQRWLGVEDGIFDKASILADDEIVWDNWSGSGEENHIDTVWMSHAVPLGDSVADGSVQIAWDLVSDQALAFGGWTIDDVCLLAPATANNRLGITDFQASDDEDSDAVVFTWTNPKHAPVERVIVVRNESGFPTSHDDGDIVYDDESPDVGAAIEATDTEAIGTLYYAVYGFDGTEWLGWTVEGWNADSGAATGTGIPDDPDTDGPGTDTDDPSELDDTAVEVKLSAGGCGCATPTAPVIPWLGLGLASLVAFRRRRNA